MAVIWVCDRRQRFAANLGGNKFATRMAPGRARALFYGIYKKHLRKREGFGDSGTGILSASGVFACACREIMEPAAEVTHSFPVCPAGTFSPVTA